MINLRKIAIHRKNLADAKSTGFNLCLGHANRKDSVSDQLVNNEINVCALQETEIPKGFPENVLNCGNYVLELETNEDKKRVGFYTRSDVKYLRRKDLEKR